MDLLIQPFLLRVKPPITKLIHNEYGASYVNEQVTQYASEYQLQVMNYFSMHIQKIYPINE